MSFLHNEFSLGTVKYQLKRELLEEDQYSVHSVFKRGHGLTGQFSLSDLSVFCIHGHVSRVFI